MICRPCGYRAPALGGLWWQLRELLEHRRRFH